MLHEKELSVLEEFADNYSKKIYGRNTAKKLKMNQKTVSNILSKLEQENILKFSQEGKNKYYFLNKFNPHIREIIQLIEIKRKINFIKNNLKIAELFKKLEERTEGALIVFGSYANGANTSKSDLDIFLIGQIKNFEDLEKLYNIKINIIKSSKLKFDKNENIIKEIIKNHIILKGAEEFVNLVW